MFAKGQKVESDIDLWHKWFGHVNFPKLQEMQPKQIVFGLLKLVAKRDNYVNLVNSESITGFNSPMSTIGAGISSI